MAAPVLLIVDAANVIGSVPDGWWRDRAGATRRLRDSLARVPVEGLRLDQRPTGASGPAGSGLDLAGVPAPVEVVLVVEGVAREVAGTESVRVVAAAGSGDDAIVALVRQASVATRGAAGNGHRSVVVVTADRRLRERVRELGATTIGPGALIRLRTSDRRTGGAVGQ
ncbi:MAG TPA: hypothetical protein VF163_04460 [Micromonosporaceae bacterium]